MGLTSSTPHQNTVSPHFLKNEWISVIKLAQDVNYDLNLSMDIPWVKHLIESLHEELLSDEKDHYLPKAHFSFQGKLVRNLDSLYEDQVLLHGQLQLSYHTSCVRCLIPMPVDLEVEVAACFLAEEFQSSPELEEADTFFVEDGEKELYFFAKKEINLEDFFRETLYLHIEPIPVHDEDCKGLCQACGVNLNTEQCPHH